MRKYLELINDPLSYVTLSVSKIVYSGGFPTRQTRKPVSYTHLDVYKRQGRDYVIFTRSHTYVDIQTSSMAVRDEGLARRPLVYYVPSFRKISCRRDY